MDIPILETRDDFVLYTDVDVIFLKHPELKEPVDILGVVPEERDGAIMFNNGVMVMNVPALRADHASFVAAIRARVLNDFKYPAHDQASYNRRYRKRFTEMPRSLNWRPYWGRNADAAIVHFHGPKADQARALERGEAGDIHPPLQALWQSDPEGYRYYCEIYEDLERGEIGQSSGRLSETTPR
ncbi:hypothetical protein [Novosphingobium sp. BW1]|uniref:hypothetical protein n=1 Tax=Novosphingobium sp. BW1 TaxID=2592621 RepID=UPI0011DEB7DC|nr:hypothetical protein [Novosphingobium sp. BW1]TYC93269.1 hypothetical protein FMM79_01465 [Novosphingobium sp. BW1]